jgi:hypothetical protein
MKHLTQIEDSAQASLTPFQPLDAQHEESDSSVCPRSMPLAAPFDEPIYTINDVAKILQLSPNQIRTIFRNEPGVHDLANNFGKSRFRRRSQLRIPHAVLTRFWKRTEIREQESKKTRVATRFERQG